MRFLYSLIILLMTPIVGFLLWLKMRHYNLQSRFMERLGFIHNPQSDIWIHASSVGEVKIANLLIQQMPSQNIVISTVTSTGFLATQQQWTNPNHFFFSFDLPFIWRRVLRIIRPKKLILLEREIWPNLINECHKQNIKTYLVNARFSTKSAKKIIIIKPLIINTLNQIQQIYTQSSADRKALIEFGIDPKKCYTAGNLKFDRQVPSGKQINLSSSPIWVAGSTHPNEETILLKIHQRIIMQHPRALLIIAPRHPERFDTVFSLIKKYGLSVARYSQGLTLFNKQSVLLLDTMGDLLDFYAIADVCFVGGSLFAGVGGHNLLEPVLLKKPVMSGIFLNETQDLQQLLGTSLTQFTDIESGFQTIMSIINNPELKQKLVTKGYQAIKNNQGATLFCVNKILQ